MTTPYYLGEGYTSFGGPVPDLPADPKATPPLPVRPGRKEPNDGTGYGIHFNLGNPSQIHKQEPKTGNETDGTGATSPYDEPLVVSPLVQQPRDCYGNCQEQERLARVHCDIIRKRVAQWMKDTGCASSVRGFKQKSKCGR